MLVLSKARDVYIVLENPIRSRLYQLPFMSYSLELVGADRIFTYLGGFGAKSLKAIELFTTVPHSPARGKLVKTIRVAKACLAVWGKADIKLAVKQVRKTKKSSGWSSSNWTSGKTTRLKDSAAYPPLFGMAIAELVHASTALP
jgi:hypothetical protein